MNSDDVQKINPNTAEIDELTELPGVGPELAQRIVAGRPYQEVDDLRRVSGIGSFFLERLRPYLSLEAASTEIQASVEEAEAATAEPIKVEEGQPLEEIQPGSAVLELQEARNDQVELEAPTGSETGAPAAAEEPVYGEANSEQADIQVPVLASEPDSSAEPVPAAASGAEGGELVSPEMPVSEPITPPEPLPAAPARSGGLTCGQIFWICAASSLVTLLLALVICLGTLAVLNGGRLQYAAPSRVNQLSLQIENLQSQTELLSQDLTGLRQRLANLESLSGRVGAMEQSVKEMDAAVDSTLEQVEVMNGEIDQLSNQVEILTAQSERFDSFLEGLNTLIDSLYSPEEQSK